MSTDSDWARELWPDDGPGPDWPGPDWPGPDWPGPDEPDWPDEGHQPRAGLVPPWIGATTPAVPHPRGPRALVLALIAVLGLGAGAGAVYLYRQAAAGSAPAAATASPSARGGGTVTTVMLLGPVLGVRGDAVTVGAPGRAVSAVVTSATRFTGTARSLAEVHAGDMVSVLITESDGLARVVTLQDPASQR